MSVIRIMGTAFDIPATENECVMVAQHAGADAEVRSRVGDFYKRTSVSVDKAIQNRSREHFSCWPCFWYMSWKHFACLGVLGWLVPGLVLLNSLLFPLNY